MDVARERPTPNERIRDGAGRTKKERERERDRERNAKKTQRESVPHRHGASRARTFVAFAALYPIMTVTLPAYTSDLHVCTAPCKLMQVHAEYRLPPYVEPL